MQEKTEVLVEGEDYEIVDGDWLVFTRGYLLRRGQCCENGCRNCPYRQQPEARACPNE